MRGVERVDVVRSLVSCTASTWNLTSIARILNNGALHSRCGCCNTFHCANTFQTNLRMLASRVAASAVLASRVAGAARAALRAVPRAPTFASAAAAPSPTAAARGFKTYTKVIEVSTTKRMEFVFLQPQVEAVLKESGIKDGMVLVNTMHTSASVFVDDHDEGLIKDMEEFASRLAPWDPIEMYKHNVNGEVNGAAHIQRAFFGREVVVGVTDGALHLGKWERILYGEFDGKRAKKVLVKVMGQ